MVAAVRRPHVAGAGGSGLVDEVLVVDDGSVDDTGRPAARAAGARVVRQSGGGGGKGQAMRAGLEAVVGRPRRLPRRRRGEHLGRFVTGLLGPLLADDDVALVKGFYERPLDGQPGGRRPGDRAGGPAPRSSVLFPELAGMRQPLAGETAAPRWVLEKVEFADGYGVELGLLVDVAAPLRDRTVAQVDLGDTDPPEPAPGRAAAPGGRGPPGRA